LPFEQRIGVSDRESTGVDDRRERDVLRVQARLEHRPQPGIGADGLERIGAVGHQVSRAMINGVRHVIRSSATLVGAHRGEARQVQNAHTHDHHADNRRDAEDLLAFDA
jgi:hypothetical protein